MDSLILSKLFTFRVGNQQQEFTVHSGAVAAVSSQLNALINNGMLESQTGSADLSDIEPVDFVRFVEYTYRNDYTSPSWVLEDKVADVEAGKSEKGKVLRPSHMSIRARNAASQVQPSQTMLRRQQQHFGSPTLPPVTLESRLMDRIYLSDAEPNVCMQKGFKHQPNTAPEQNFAPVFLAHARLYTFACKRFIDPLKRLALHKLRGNLLDFTPFHRRLVDVVELVRYAYDHCENRKDDGTVDELRMLVTEYVGCQISLFKNDKDFVQLLEEGREFTVDLVRVIDEDKLR